MMKCISSFVLVIAIASAGSASLNAVSLQPAPTHYSSAQIKKMIHEAHSADQYRAIARYYEERHAEFSQKAADEMAEWARRSENTLGPAAKYPRPVDAARNLYEYYAHEADDAAFQAEKYYRFAAGVEATTKVAAGTH
jgi:hypothetical protein